MDLPSTFHYESWAIRYTIFCSRPASKDTQSIVFVHGTPWSSAVFQPLIKTLLASSTPYRILAYDLPEYGRSQTYDASAPSAVDKLGYAGDTSIAFQARALTALLQHTQFSIPSSAQPPAVVAHDIAGAIVLRTHLLHGCDFSTMFLCSTNAVLPWGDGFYNLVRNQPQVFVDLPADIFEAMVRAVVKSAMHCKNVGGGNWVDVLVEPWVAGGVESVEPKKWQRSFVRQIAQTNDEDVREMLDGDMYSNVRCDVKIVLGGEDKWIPRKKVEELRERIGGRVKELVILPDAGHLVMLDQPNRFEDEVVGWLTCF